MPLRAFTNQLRKANNALIIFVRLSACLHGVTRLKLDGFSWSWRLEICLTVCWRVPIAVKPYNNNRHCT